ncbi:hypothetical protein SAMN04488034_1198 [Salinimicrobium catena]|uniref:Uncharacterized protein n=1 Tax=Salinimicrobium catena TaxID=390640 RepID=A0A1H5PI09_9FLAO|nr:hypothetical protein [Salinimicrobium catena]SDL86688.1 hypothetical protein SAMN04488140_1208 [Salinimicrobium catena]SEF13355.1 hypothetical protein SAMN04488034_1198 [Salinimicrobium catena]
MTELFNNREIAFIFWSLIFIILGSIKIQFWGVIKAFFQETIIDTFLLSIIYVELALLLLTVLDFWEINLLKDTILWFLGSACISIYNSIKAIDIKDYFRKNLIDTFKFIFLFEFIINFYTLPLVWEIITFPFILIIAIANFQFQYQKEETAKKFTNGILAIFGLFIFSYSISQLISDPKPFLTITNLKTFVLPIILTILFIPFTYFLVVYMQYDSMFRFIGFRFTKKEKEFKKIKKRIIQYCLLSIKRQKKLRKSDTFGYILSYEDIENTIKEL